MKSFAGWLQALTVGHPDTLIGDLTFTVMGLALLHAYKHASTEARPIH